MTKPCSSTQAFLIVTVLNLPQTFNLLVQSQAVNRHFPFPIPFFFRFWETTCSPSSPSWRAWTSSRTRSPWWRTEPSPASPSSPRCCSSTTDWEQPPRRSCSLWPASPTSVSTTTPGAATARWTAWSGPCRFPATATWADMPSVRSPSFWGARSWSSWMRRCCVQPTTRWTRSQFLGCDQDLHRSWGQRPRPCATPTCSPNHCSTAATKVRLSHVLLTVHSRYSD